MPFNASGMFCEQVNVLHFDQYSAFAHDLIDTGDASIVYYTLQMKY